MDTAKKKRKSNLNKLSRLKKGLNDLLAKRDSLRTQFGVRPYQKNIWNQYPLLHEQYLKIQNQTSKIKGLEKTLLNSKLKITNLKDELTTEIKNNNAKWSAYMMHRRLFVK